MRGATSVSLERILGKQFNPIRGKWGGIVPSLEPKKPGNEGSSTGRTIAEEKAADPIVAFSKPPPLPPFLGPLVALSLLDSWSGRDSEDA